MVDRAPCPQCGTEVGQRHGRLVKHAPCDDVRYGTPPADPYDRAMRHVRRKGEHLIWTGYLMNGAPTLQVRRPGRRRTPTGAGRTSLTVRRIVWRKHRGELPAGAVVLPTCSEPRCIAIDHLVTRGKPSVEEHRRRAAARAAERERLATRDAAIVADYQAGELLRVIKAKHGVEATQVYTALRKAGVKPGRGVGQYDRHAAAAARALESAARG